MHTYSIVQLKGNLKHADRTHTTYWPKVCIYINLYWCMQEVKPANINFQKVQKWVKRALQWIFTQVHTFPSLFMYIRTYIHNYLASFLHSRLYATN